MVGSRELEDAAKWFAQAGGDHVVNLTRTLAKLTDLMAYSGDPEEVMRLRKKIKRLTHIRDQLVKPPKEKSNALV